VERSLYLILKELNERLNLRRLSGFNEIELEDSMPCRRNFYIIKRYIMQIFQKKDNICIA
jgi:hypothetical protein